MRTMLALTIGASTLAISILFDPSGLVIPVFTIAIAISLWDGLRLLLGGKVRWGLLVIAAVAVLFGCTMMCWYAKHSTPWEEESHRHSFWSVGHVH